MSDTKFTPGPWEVGFRDPPPKDGPERKGVAFVNAGAETIAKTDARNYLSNANLIAAAPDLYEALEKALPALSGKAYLDARAALAKARGE